MYIPLKPSGYTSERNLVLISPFTKRVLTITSRSNGMLCVTPKNKIQAELENDESANNRIFSRLRDLIKSLPYKPKELSFTHM